MVATQCMVNQHASKTLIMTDCEEGLQCLIHHDYSARISGRLYQTVHVRKNFTPLTDGAVHISFLHFILAHYISAFIPVKDK